MQSYAVIKALLCFYMTKAGRHEYERSLYIMDDGYSPVSILVLIGFILLEAVFYGFGSAIQNVKRR